MAALSSNDGRFAVKTLRITYQELIELADALESEKKDKSPKRKSKDNDAESSCKTDISPRKDEETVGQVDEEKSSDTKRSEKKSKDDKKSSKKRDSDKKKHKERSHGHGEEKSPKKEPDDDQASENQNKDKLELEISNSLTSSRTQELNDGEVSEQQKCIEKKKHRKRTAKSKEKSGEETADLEDNEGKLQIDDLDDNILAKDIKCKKKSKSKEEKTQKNSEFKTKGKKKSSHVEVDSENNTSEASAIVQKVLNTEEDEPEKDKTDHCKHGGGILKSPNSKSIHSHAHVSFSEKNESHVSEERGILRIPQGVNIHVDELRGSDCVDEYCRSSEHMLKKVDNDDSSSHISSSLQSSEESEQKSHKTDKHYESKTQTSEEGNSKMNTAEKRLRALNRQRAQQLTKQARHVEITLGNLLSKGVTDRGTLNKVFTLSNEIQDLYQGVIMLDLSFAQQQDIDQLLWKNAFYQVIETFRKYGKLFLGYTNQKDTISPEKINAELHDFLENSSRFYSGLLQGLQSTYHFEIQEIITQPRKAELLGRNAKLALLSCHHTLIFLGDIERYKEQLQPSNNENWSGIRSWYLKASKLAPKNGKPYNQLAVIAVYANRKLDAIFYYVRSLSVNSPILTAKEKLTTIYHEIQKKELVEDHLHIAAVREFAMLVSSMTNPTLEYSEETMQYSAVIPSVPASTGQMNSCVAVHIDVEHVDDQESYESHEVIIEGGLENTDLGDEPDKGFKELKAVVHDNVSRAHLMFENNPSYLVPDTNCFIDQLSGLQAILMSSDFTLVVPIVVINELDGLKKDFMVNKYHDFNHAQMVMNNARAAIDFLEDQFSLRSPYVKALTSKGTVMDTIAFRRDGVSGILVPRALE
ncbi:hypothetical protein QZH41_000167 [Actinostola sp. cb2023]|nr:hypothetical protein QZH41_000167 [Actinostola sp. cb2023]